MLAIPTKFHQTHPAYHPIFTDGYHLLQHELPFYMSLTEQDVARIARLARIDLPANGRADILAKLDSLLHLIDRLQAVNTQGVEPMAHPLAAHQEMSLRLRDDVVTETSDIDRRNALTNNAPAMSKGLFLVPKVIE